MSQAFVDQVTLDYLLNKEMYNSHVNNKKAAQVNKEERKLYKKRVYNLFKEIITCDEPIDLLPDVKYAYNNFFNACIHYLKAKDTNDLVQSEYKDYIFNEENEIITDVSLNEINQQENCLEADKMMLRSIKMPPEASLDKQSLRKSKKFVSHHFLKVKNNIDNIYEDTSKQIKNNS
jgi:hypothetical protein